MKVELHSEEPDRPLSPRLSGVLEDATRIDIAVAFVTDFGADEIQAIFDRVKDRAQMRLLVSVLFPTDLHSIQKLANNIEVFIHLGRTNVAEKLHWQFHSKIVLIEHEGQARTVVIGSHNWTKNGLDGGNLEASLILACDECDKVVGQTRAHIEACRRVSERFDPDRISLYQAIQRQFHPLKPGSSQKMTFAGFDGLDAIVILAEGHSEELGESGELFFNVPAELLKQFRINTEVQLFMYRPGSLFGHNHPLPEPHLYCGRIENNDLRASESQDRAGSYVIRDIAYPRVEAVNSIPPRSGDEMQVVVPFNREHWTKPIPLFHAVMGEPHAIFVVEDKPEHQVYSDTAAAAPENLRHPMDADCRMVPTELVAQMILKVPFKFVYPSQVATCLESLGSRQLILPTEVPLRVIMEPKTGVSDYVCRVKYRSDPGLTKAIYFSPADLVPKSES